MKESAKVRVGVVGATGYAGIELLHILLSHPFVDVVYAAGSHESTQLLSEISPALQNDRALSIQKFDADACAKCCDAVFVALPAGVSGHVAAEMWRRGKVVVDLSGDLRLSRTLYEEWYGQQAVDPEIVKHAVYGLTEWNRDEVRGATLIANPGCYATAALLAILPMVRGTRCCEEARPILVDAKSGVSGAGRKPGINRLYGELAENFYAYKVGHHQHTPEIESQVSSYGNHPILMTTQLLPLVRGIYVSCYVPVSGLVDDHELRDIFLGAYADDPFVRVLPPGSVPELAHVRGTNCCEIGFYSDKRTSTVQVFAAIDNLQKGAAGQAVQNFNLMSGFPETTALPLRPMFP